MSRQIADVVLFISRFSRESAPCVQAITGSKLPIKIIPLDTASARDAALNGSTIQIRSVPSLLVEFDDGNIQLFVGRPKIMGWMKHTLQQQQPPQAGPAADKETSARRTKLEDFSSSSSSSEEEPSPPPRRKSRRRKPPSKASRSSSKKEKPKKRQPRPNVTSMEPTETPVELIMEEGPRPGRPPQPSTSGLMVGQSPKSSNKSLMTAAQQMMADRDSTLGYKADK